jgi:hypothetical protein
MFKKEKKITHAVVAYSKDFGYNEQMTLVSCLHQTGTLDKVLMSKLSW